MTKKNKPPSLLSLKKDLTSQDAIHSFRIRTITAGVTLSSLTDTSALNDAIDFLNTAKLKFNSKGYEVQTLRISTQNLYYYLNQNSYEQALPHLVEFDKIAKRNNVFLCIGQILPPDKYQNAIADWAKKLVQTTTRISFSLPISSHEIGIHFNSIKAASEIITSISKFIGGEANFRFTASANCPAGIPFFPAAFHEGNNSFAIGLETANLVTESFKSNSNPANARLTLKTLLEKNLIPVQKFAEGLSKALKWKYDGIDASPAPGLDASIGEAIETYSKQPFGNPATLSACSLITDVLKNLEVIKCGYSGLMLPIIEDKVLAQRAMEGRFTIQELLLYSTVSGTGLDVVPIPGDTPKQVLKDILIDVAALSLKYSSKALSVRLFLLPGKKAGDIVKFDNPYLTSTAVMKVY
jgi:hypothetical protein